MNHPSENYTPKNAFLELGSTSIKFYLVALSGERAGEVEKEIKIPWDLGFEVFQSNHISPTSIAFCLKTLKELSVQYPDIPFEGVTAIGTAALREAQNVEIFRRLLNEQLGLRLGIIEGGIEAFLLENGFKDSITDYPTGLFDLGGGEPRVGGVPDRAFHQKNQSSRRRDPPTLQASTVARYVRVHTDGTKDRP